MDEPNNAQSKPGIANKPRWYVARSGERQGPLSYTAVIGMAETDTLETSDLVWRPGFLDWTEAGHVPGLLIPPPLPETAGANSALPKAGQPEDRKKPAENGAEAPAHGAAALAEAAAPTPDGFGEEKMRALRARISAAVERQH